jgi:hypothetical protein
VDGNSEENNRVKKDNTTFEREANFKYMEKKPAKQISRVKTPRRD